VFADLRCPMKFTHLVEINDPLNPLIDPLSRDQLWRGLVLRAEQPRKFVPWLDGCDIVERTNNSITRNSRYGELVIGDTVIFTPQESIHYQVPPQKDIPASDLYVTIEEPQSGLLFVRFEYDDHLSETESNADAFYNEFRRSAYQEADIDTIREIRQLAAAGALGS
jgi:hypothetical protein